MDANESEFKHVWLELLQHECTDEERWHGVPYHRDHQADSPPLPEYPRH